MNNFFTQLKEKARAIKLSHDEKQVMRVRLYNYLEQNPIGTFNAPAKIPTPMPSPFYFFSPTNWQNLNTRWMVPIALLLVVGLSGGTAFAAEGALPGSPLYAVKIHINEPVQVALATTPVAKAEVQARLATTRLEEAETLAANGTLDATTTAELASNFSTHVKAAQTVTQDLSASDPGTAAQLDTDFNSTLAAHGSILAQIGDNSKSDETMQNSNALALQVQQEADRGNGDSADNGAVTLAIVTNTETTNSRAPAAPQNGARVRTFEAMAPRTDEPSSTASSSASTTASISANAKNKSNALNSVVDARIASSLGVQASSTLVSLSQDFATINPSLDGTTAAQIAAQMETMQTLYASATAALAAGNASGAKDSFSALVRNGIRLDAYLKAGQKFNLHLLSGLLDNSANTNDGGSHNTIDNGAGKQNGDSASPGPASTSSINAGGQEGDNGSSDGGNVNVNPHL